MHFQQFWVWFGEKGLFSVTTLKDFYELQDRWKDREVLQQFVDEHFDPPGFELIEWYPEDWAAFPSSFLKIEDYHLRRWALHLHRIWRDLCRRVKDDVRLHQELYSLLYVPHPFIIPGGRFREFYYWDSFWIVKGLLFSEMYETAKGIIRNLAYMVENHGFVPNGGRVYYLIRSQPPLLTPMVYEYFLATGDLDLVQEVRHLCLLWVKVAQCEYMLRMHLLRTVFREFAYSCGSLKVLRAKSCWCRLVACPTVFLASFYKSSVVIHLVACRI
ncbi:unnamed protein product [Gongylonema pulchrum]|uniref:Trehalase n=1 Tax=Gongylonema pulchrum TaxID=637853 RepID=A0A183EP84_9BILA|nr:unnamed protein product [Gongylonema pulchrum]